MQKIEGLTKEETLKILTQYFNFEFYTPKFRNDISELFICNFIDNRANLKTFHSNIWKFIFFYYEKLDYRKPHEANLYNGCSLFQYCMNTGLPNKIAERKVFVSKIINELNKTK